MLTRALLVASMAVAACPDPVATKHEVGATSMVLPELDQVSVKLAFTCVHEADHLPPLDPEADQLFQYARYLQKQDGPPDYFQMGRLYRIAAAYGHYKANNNLQHLVSEGDVSSPDRVNETLDLNDALIKQNIPIGYYNMGRYLELGFGVKKSEEKALTYFRHAADLGNPDAQYYVGELIAPTGHAVDVVQQMRRCAAGQGHGKAAYTLALYFQNEREFGEALQFYQKGVSSGDSLAADALEGAFDPKYGKSEFNNLDVQPDQERSRRYLAIANFLDRNEFRNPKLPDIDKIVPLPPAPLPAWDGTFQWEKDQAKPAKPDEALVRRLAEAKKLNPETGLPWGDSSLKSRR